MATPCTNSLGGESGGQKHEGCGLDTGAREPSGIKALSLSLSPPGGLDDVGARGPVYYET